MTSLITEHLDIWTSAREPKKTGGRGRGKKTNGGTLYGIKKLRELILELAVRGKLVPPACRQAGKTPTDEPASMLLKKIAREKARLVKEGKIKKQKKLPEISEDEKPFELPVGWGWARLGNFVYLEMGQSPPSKFYNREQNGIPFFQGKADFGDLYPTPRYWCTQPTKYAFSSDVLLSVRAPVGPTNISNIDCCIGRGLAALRPFADTSTEFILIIMRAFQRKLESFATGTTFAAVSKTHVELLLVPIPPLAEQHRIVAKVDELMALCDRLEQQQNDSNATHQSLLETLLATLTNATDYNEFTKAWQRFANHFDTLFTTEQSIDQLKQTILQLAVMGKLVPPACRQAGKIPTSLPISKKGVWWVYVIECEDGSFYKGFTENLPRRWQQHLAGTASDWTKKHPPKQVFYWEECYSKAAAIKRERYLKSGSGREWFKREVVENEEAWQPASVLLKKIAKEKSRLIKDGKIKKQKKLPEIMEEEKPFELPKGWVWVRLGVITSKITDGDHKTPPRISKGYRLLSAKNVRDGYLDFANCDFISEQHYLKSRERCLPKTGDLLIVSVGGTIGRTSLVSDNSSFSLVRSVALIKPLLFNSSYLKLAMDSELLQTSIHGRKRGGAQPCLYLSEISQFIFSLPPLAEQYRIVAKVDELMALCDALTARLEDARITEIQLADAVVNQVVV